MSVVGVAFSLSQRNETAITQTTRHRQQMGGLAGLAILSALQQQQAWLLIGDVNFDNAAICILLPSFALLRTVNCSTPPKNICAISIISLIKGGGIDGCKGRPLWLLICSVCKCLHSHKAGSSPGKMLPSILDQ